MSERIAGQALFHAFVWNAGSMTDLGLIGGFDISQAVAINNSAQVVGQGRLSNRDRGFLYSSEKGLRDLDDLIPFDSGWYDLSPRDINDAGQIIGVGTHGGRHAFLMTPMPPIPTTSLKGLTIMCFLLLGAGAVIVIRRGRQHPIKTASSIDER